MCSKNFVIGDDNDEQRGGAVVDPEMSLIDVDCGRLMLTVELMICNCIL